ncbi:MAG: hypothetical protein ACMUJM_19150 [bacterium]
MTKKIFCKVLLVIVTIFGLMVLSGVLSAQGNRDWAFDRVIEVQERNTDRLMAMDGVEGTAIGVGQNGQLAIRVFTAGPGVRGIPQQLDGVPVQVVITGKIYALTTERYERPVPIGVSTGHPDITAGTIGCRVYDDDNNNGSRDDGEIVYALSNNHVYANSNEASIGDSVIQPGPFDGGNVETDVIGTLFDFEPIVFSRRAKNVIDAAIALTDTEKVGTTTPTSEGGYGTPNSTIVGASIGQKVQKFGRTTKLTKGEVTGVNATVNISYGVGKTARFVNQIIIEPGDFSLGGDSGSLIVTDDDYLNPVGLLFAGSSTITVANRIDLVLAAFNVTVDGEEPTVNVAPVVSIISPNDGTTFDSSEVITFEGEAMDNEDGDLSASLVWTSSIDGEIGQGGSVSGTLSEGMHTITASVTDSGGKTGSDSVSITVGTPPAEPTAVSVVSIKYSTEGRGRHLLITVALLDDLGNVVEGASVSIELYRNKSLYGSGTGTTGSDGTVTFKAANAPSGTYTTKVTDVIAGVLEWDGITPTNSYDK